MWWLEITKLIQNHLKHNLLYLNLFYINNFILFYMIYIYKFKISLIVQMKIIYYWT